MRFALTLAALLALAIPVTALEITDVARVVDGDTPNVEGLGVRLHGIDAPETAQRCADGQGRDYACGERATARLRGLAENRRVVCEGREFDQYKRFVAVCRVPCRRSRDQPYDGRRWSCLGVRAV